MFNLPKRLLKFWYSDAFFLFIRVWHNLINILEEDLAVSLMWRLLFVPLFHDSSFIGRILSFIFRLTRVLFGITAYFFASLGVFSLALVWFLLPILLFWPSLNPFSLSFKLLFIFGIALFINENIFKPIKKVADVKITADLFLATKLKKSDLTWEKLIEALEVKELIWNLETSLDSLPKINLNFTDEYLNIVWNLAKQAKANYLTPDYFFVAALIQKPLMEKDLLNLNLTTTDFKNCLNFLEKKRQTWRKIFIWDLNFAVTHLKGVNRGWLGAPTPNLDSVSIDLTREASINKFPDFVGREKTVSEVVNILSQDTNQNVIIVGPTGSGKTALVEFLAKIIIAGDAPASLATKRLVSLDLASLLAGVISQGDLAAKIQAIFDEVKFIQNIIIFVDEMQNLGVGEAGVNFNLYSLMLPFLESNALQFLATTEQDSFAKILEKNSAFARVFTKVELTPATEEETILILENFAIDLERYQKIKLSFAAIKLLSKDAKFINDRVLPDSALFILNEAKTRQTKNLITTLEIKETLKERVNIPIDEVSSDQKENLLNLEQTIHQKLIDQEEAVQAIADTLRRQATSLREQSRPIGSFLFVGPTGVGKTELAKILAEVFFKDEQSSSSNKAAYLRFDMSEYQTIDSINRLIGDGNQLGELTEAIRSKPYTLLLLDEFEKANSKLLNLFLQVLDDGRLTDFSGKTIDFTNTIIIATSNAGSLMIAKEIKKGKSVADLSAKVKDELLKIFKPELVNRFDEVVIFKPLSENDLEKIVRLKLLALDKTLKDQGYLVEFDEKLISLLAQKGFDPVLGARPLRRLIQDTLEARLSRLILENRISKGETFKASIDLLS
ncbi:ATP-dependent Clp protease ATP-binding subunit [Candidatus Daviesbacteria bacterium]|nr:ATP-dependent Clp protease ATP-binding subunit [Candidatus Daviesbacteria bacterium]